MSPTPRTETTARYSPREGQAGYKGWEGRESLLSQELPPSISVLQWAHFVCFAYFGVLIFKAIRGCTPTLLVCLPRDIPGALCFVGFSVSVILVVLHRSLPESCLGMSLSSLTCQFKRQGLERNHMSDKVLSG